MLARVRFLSCGLFETCVIHSRYCAEKLLGATSHVLWRHLASSMVLDVGIGGDRDSSQPFRLPALGDR